MPYFVGGERIRIIVDPKKPKYYDFQVKLTETRKETNDGSCMNYPSPEHETYTACVDEELRAIVVPTLGCMIPWMSEQDKCTGHLTRLPEYQQMEKWLSNIIQDSWRGVQYKSTKCPLPCNLVIAKTFYLLSGSAIKNEFGLYIEDDVKVERTVLAYGFTDLLVEIGSCLGLWLGLSVVGIFDILVLCAASVQRFFKSVIKKKKNRLHRNCLEI